MGQSAEHSSNREAAMELVVETDARSRVVLPGHPGQRFLVHENSDGSLLLQPARVVSEAQLEYDTNPELRELLARTAQAPTVRRSRQRRES
jgi:hypothetical protein